MISFLILLEKPWVPQAQGDLINRLISFSILLKKHERHKNKTIGIVVCDIDKFKRINDNYNHVVGDKVIQHFAGT
ncbi:GGDEF domain-containing protein [Bacillus sp. sid0103]|uniref:diguanylate cyclase domain-containing protein n=1 Tax=Bacillus sp. sid0103 TaxID=2856337 RepID=UPI001C4790AB|nr:diguanylate cyclase [Bacillus sp. sid0103]MBV7506175.1 GGDEF domain-containing protein [Bacillus sp. sid0103]